MTESQLLICEKAIGLLSLEGMRGVYDGEQARRFDRAEEAIEQALEIARAKIES